MIPHGAKRGVGTHAKATFTGLIKALQMFADQIKARKRQLRVCRKERRREVLVIVFFSVQEQKHAGPLRGFVAPAASDRISQEHKIHIWCRRAGPNYLEVLSTLHAAFLYGLMLQKCVQCM